MSITSSGQLAGGGFADAAVGTSDHEGSTAHVHFQIPSNEMLGGSLMTRPAETLTCCSHHDGPNN